MKQYNEDMRRTELALGASQAQGATRFRETFLLQHPATPTDQRDSQHLVKPLRQRVPRNPPPAASHSLLPRLHAPTTRERAAQV